MPPIKSSEFPLGITQLSDGNESDLEAYPIKIETEKARRYSIDKDTSQLISILRFVAIAFVVVLHNTTSLPSKIDFSSGASIWFWAMVRHTIADPPIYLFFSISGLLLFRKPFNALDNIKKKAYTLLIPYVCWIMFWIAVTALVQINDSGFMDSLATGNFPPVPQWSLGNWIDAFFGYWNPSGMPFLYPFWFLRDLIILNIVAWPLFWLTRKLPWVSLAIALAVLLLDPPIHIVGNSALSMFMIGGVISSVDFKLETIKQIPYWILLPVWGAMGIFSTLFHAISVVPAMEVLVGVVAYVRCAQTIQEHARCNRTVLRLSAFTFIVYASHEFTLSALNLVWKHFVPDSDVLNLIRWMMLPCVVIVICIAFGILLRKLLPNMYKLLTGGRLTEAAFDSVRNAPYATRDSGACPQEPVFRSGTRGQ